MDEGFYEDARLHWRDGHDTVAHVDITAGEVVVHGGDGSFVHFHETTDDPDGTLAYREDEPEEAERGAAR